MRVGIPVLGGLISFLMVLPGAAAQHAPSGEDDASFSMSGPVELYHHYLIIENDLKDWKAKYPDYFTYEVVGKSVLGLNVYAMTITNFKSASPPMEARPRVYFDGAIHGNEQLGMETAMDIAKWLLEGYGSDPLAKKSVDTKITYIIPQVNPDGDVRDMRHNANDVDLNRNFPAGWGGPGSAAKGPKPLSEPETQIIAKYMDKVRPQYVNSFHTGTVMLLFAYGNTKEPSPDFAMYTQICQRIQESMNKANGRPVPCGQIYTTIYPASGSTVDFAYDRYGAVSFTMEVDNEQNLYANVDAQYGDLRTRLGEAWASIRDTYENLERYGALLNVTDVRARMSGDKMTAVDVTVMNEGLGASNNTVLRLAGSDGKMGPQIKVSSIAPGQSQTVRVPATVKIDVGSQVQVDLQYNKTFWKGFGDHVTVGLDAVKEGGAIVLKQAQGIGQPQSVANDGSKGSSPGFDVVLLAVAAIVGMGAFRRGRSRQ